MDDWKETEIGPIPSTWFLLPIGEIGNVTKLAGFEYTKHIEYVEDGEIIALRALNIRNGKLDLSNIKKIYRFVSDNLIRSKLKKHDIIFTYVGANIGQFALVPENNRFHLAPNICRIRCENNCDPFFLYSYFRTEYFKESLDGFSHGSSQPTMPMGSIRQIPIPLPPLPEQKAIASVLSSLDDKIDLLHRQNKTLEAMAETLFRQWFVEDAREDWEVIPFEAFFDFLEGPGIRNWQYTETGTPFINIRLISNGDIDVSKANKVSAEVANGKYNHFQLEKGDMVVSTSGTLGKKAIVRSYHLPLLLNTSVIRFRPRDGQSYAFVYQYLNSRLFQEHLECTASGSVQANFGPTHLKAMTFLMPPNDVLNNYLGQANPIYHKIENNQVQIHTLEKLRDTLLPKLMSGEVRVEYEN